MTSEKCRFSHFIGNASPKKGGSTKTGVELVKQECIFLGFVSGLLNSYDFYIFSVPLAVDSCSNYEPFMNGEIVWAQHPENETVIGTKDFHTFCGL